MNNFASLVSVGLPAPVFQMHPTGTGARMYQVSIGGRLKFIGEQDYDPVMAERFAAMKALSYFGTDAVQRAISQTHPPAPPPCELFSV